jgi:3-(3-hydroxy-phenyl)propionate hydroxylase
VLLVGDAAHATNPTGGLGLTTGLFDAFSLWPALSSVIVEGGDPAILDTWAIDRRRVFWELTSPAATENKRIIYSEPDPEQRRRDLEAIRAWTSDPGALRARLLFTARLATHHPRPG